MKAPSKKGVAGLNIFLAVIVMLFMIGLIVMVFAVAGNKLIAVGNLDNTSITIVNETVNAIGESVDWFSTFIVLAALVVLILMVVLIVTSIRGTGYVGGGEGLA